MKTVLDNQEIKNLNSKDRCDQCDSQAYVLVAGISGVLMFCGHHYAKIESNPVANKRLKAFAYSINDERNKISGDGGKS
jgi:hypothetical protein